jgi:hypothetical protein
MEIEANIHALRQDPAEKRLSQSDASDMATGFSYAMASASIERRAGASLQAHGGKPADAAPAVPTNNRPHNTADASHKTAQNDSERQNGSADLKQTHATSAGPVSQAAVSRDGIGAQATLTATGAAAPNAPTIQSQANPGLITPRAQSATTAASLSETAARKETLKTVAKAPPQAVAKPQESFAALLAKRLDAKTSVFDIRLDPPELGRISGRFEITDDGAGALKLSFDTQSTFDMFRRDEAALRQALADAGVSLDGQSLLFDYTPEDFDWRSLEKHAAHQTTPSELSRAYAAHLPSSLVDLFT